MKEGHSKTNMAEVKNPKRPIYKHLLFDLDRTLWDFDANSKEAVTEIYEHFELYNFVRNFEVFLAKYRTINERLWLAYRNNEVTKQELVDQRFYLTFRSFGFDDIRAGHEAGQMYLELSATKTHLFPEAKETLAKLADHYTIHILSNGFKTVQFGKVENCGLAPYITSLITSDDAGFQKPDKRIFDYAFKTIDARPEECLMIGDDEKTDIKGAQNAGVDYIWFNPKKYASAIKSQYTISQLAELTELL